MISINGALAVDAHGQVVADTIDGRQFTEYGAAELEGLTVRERGEALAAIAHPRFRDEIARAATAD